MAWKYAATQCRAKGCRRKTKADSGYCWQHEDMAEVAKVKWPEDRTDADGHSETVA